MRKIQNVKRTRNSITAQKCELVDNLVESFAAGCCKKSYADTQREEVFSQLEYNPSIHKDIVVVFDYPENTMRIYLGSVNADHELWDGHLNNK